MSFAKAARGSTNSYHQTGPSEGGFSLLELSIVLVIIGLLAGGVMTGQSLIRAAELRAVVTEYQRFTTANNAFRDKYQAIPGDFKIATSFWGKDNVKCSVQTGTTATPGTCNGDGNGKVTEAAAASATGEIFRFWQQLALAGMIEGTYSGIAGTGSTTHCILGTNCPASKLTNSGWGAISLDNFAGDGSTFAYDMGGALLFGGAAPDYLPAWASLKPEEAWMIDTKTDDGKPGLGRVIGGGIATDTSNCVKATSNTDRAAIYNLTISSTLCNLYFTKVF